MRLLVIVDDAEQTIKVKKNSMFSFAVLKRHIFIIDVYTNKSGIIFTYDENERTVS